MNKELALFLALCTSFLSQTPFAAAPVVTSTAITQAMEDAAYSYKVTALDSDINDNLTWSVKSGTTLPS
jgi:hypothetical protein